MAVGATTTLVPGMDLEGAGHPEPKRPPPAGEGDSPEALPETRKHTMWLHLPWNRARDDRQGDAFGVHKPQGQLIETIYLYSTTECQQSKLVQCLFAVKMTVDKPKLTHRHTYGEGGRRFVESIFFCSFDNNINLLSPAAAAAALFEVE